VEGINTKENEEGGRRGEKSGASHRHVGEGTSDFNIRQEERRRGQREGLLNPRIRKSIFPVYETNSDRTHLKGEKPRKKKGFETHSQKNFEHWRAS